MGIKVQVKTGKLTVAHAISMCDNAKNTDSKTYHWLLRKQEARRRRR